MGSTATHLFINPSNLLAATLLLFGAFQRMAHRKPTALSQLSRSAAVLQIAVVGIAFAILLCGVDSGAPQHTWPRSPLCFLSAGCCLNQQKN